MNEIVTIQHREVVTTSLKVAEVFGKRHKNVLQAIERMECSGQFARLNFQQCFRINELANGKKEPYFKITRDVWGK